MLLITKAIVLQSFKYGENALISKVFTLEKGLLSVISKNSRSKKEKTKNYFLPLSRIQLVCKLSKNSNIHRLKEVSFLSNIKYQDSNISLNAIRFFISEFLSKVIKEEEQNTLLYQFLDKKIVALFSLEQNLGVFHIYFLIELFEYLGIQPSISEEDQYFDFIEGYSTSKKPSHKDYCEKKQYLPLLMIMQGEKKFDKAEKSKLLNLIIKYYSIQLGSGVEKLKSKPVLEAIFS